MFIVLSHFSNPLFFCVCVRFLLFRPFFLLDLHFHDVIALAYSGHVAQLKKTNSKKLKYVIIDKKIIIDTFYLSN